MKRDFGLALGAALFVSSCATGSIESKLLTSDRAKDSGLQYALPKGRLKMQVTLGYRYYAADQQKKFAEKVEVALLAPSVTSAVAVPDPDARYHLALSPSVLADDHFCISVGQNGLLQSVGVVNADRSADIIQKIAETIAVFTTGAPTGGILKADGGGRKGVNVWEKAPFVEVVFDPDSETERKSMQQRISEALAARIAAVQADVPAALKAAEPAIDAKLKTLSIESNLGSRLAQGGDLITFTGGLKDEVVAAPTGPVGGVYYRMSGERRFEVAPYQDQGAGGVGSVGGRKQESILLLPDRVATGWIAVSRAPMVRKQTTLTLVNGTLTAVDVNKPSEGLALVSVPLNVAGAVIETPARFFTSIAKATKSETALVSAKAELFAAQAELEKLKAGQEGKPQGGSDFQGSTGLGSATKPPGKFESGLNCGGAPG